MTGVAQTKTRPAPSSTRTKELTRSMSSAMIVASVIDSATLTAVKMTVTSTAYLNCGSERMVAKFCRPTKRPWC